MSRLARTLSIRTDRQIAALDITAEVSQALPSTYSGLATVYVEHTTAAVTINEAETRLLADIETALSGLVEDEGWQHDAIDDNAAAHLRALIIGPSTVVPVKEGQLQLGRWQSVLFLECDGPRTRTVQLYTA